MASENTTYTHTKRDNDGVARQRSGLVVFDATAITTTDYVQIHLGFKPKYVEWVNITDRISGEYYQGMADDSCLKSAAAGTRTLEVTGGNKGITLTDDGFQVAQNATLGLIAASKTCAYRAWA